MYKKRRGKQNKAGNNINIKTFPYQNQNFISISRKIIVPLMEIKNHSEQMPGVVDEISRV